MGKKVFVVAVVVLFTFGQLCSLAADTSSAAGGGGTASSSAVESVIIFDSGIQSSFPGGAAIPDQPSAVDVKVSKDEAMDTALELMEKYIGVKIDAKEFRSSAQLNPYYETQTEKLYSWHFSWTSSSSTMYSHFNIEIDASTGKLLSYNRSESYRNPEHVNVAVLTKEQARKAAEEFLKNICPDEFAQVELDDDGRQIVNYSIARPNYNFSYIRKVNGLRCFDSYIAVAVNGASGDISSYNFRWDYDAVFPAPDNLIGKEKALDIYKRGAEMNLRYIPVSSRAVRYMGPEEVKLAYYPQMPAGFILNAKTGEFIRQEWASDGTESKVTRNISPNKKRSLSAGKAEPSGKNAEMGIEAAKARINELVKEFFGAGYKAGDLNHSGNYAIVPTESSTHWNAEVLEDKPEAIEGKGSISIDSITGEIYSINRYLNEDWYGKEYQRKINWEQAYDKAAEILTEHFPYRLEEIETEMPKEERLYQVNGKMLPDRMVYFHFPRLVNGIRYDNDYISITVDTKTGEIYDLFYRWNKELSFPKAEGIISSEKAREVFFNTRDIEPYYYKHIEKTSDGKYTSSYKVVYTLRPKQYDAGSNIDAFTGRLLDGSGREVRASQLSFEELIKGRPEEKELSILAFQGIIDSWSFEPEREATYMELIRMLVNAKGFRPVLTRDLQELSFKNLDKGDENYIYISEAVRYGIIKNEPVELKLDEKVTREQAAELLVKLMKYDKLAQAGNIFVLEYKDSAKVSSELKGHVAIIRGLGIMDGNDGMFRPKDNIKLHEAALSVYRALESMK